MSGAASQCAQLVERASAGVAPALRAVDCMAGEMTAGAFNRLFGAEGAMAPVLTICLTLYIGFFALSLLTGRSSLGISALTPRMLTLGLVLTFATSWLAYSQVFWNLVVAGPDWVAGVLLGSGGSATQLFADRIDIVFAAIGRIGEAAAAAGGGAAGGEGAAAATASGAGGMFKPADVMWLGALILLLGTVGVLLAARIALAVLVAAGPVFVVLALFSGTRGLAAGWLRGVVLCALTPLLVVLGGAVTLELLAPVLAGLAEQSFNGVSARGAMALFVIAFVHVALMALALRLATGMVAGWQVFGLAREGRESGGSAGTAAPAPAAVPAFLPVAAAAAPAPRRGGLAGAAAGATGPAGSATGGEGASPGGAGRRVVVTQVTGGGIEPVAARGAGRARGIGSRFKSANDSGIHAMGRIAAKEKTG